MLGPPFFAPHDRWIKLSHRQKLASRKRDFSGVEENSSDRERSKKGGPSIKLAVLAQTRESTPRVRA